MAKWTVTGVSSANTAKTITKAAVTDRRHYVEGYMVVIKGADAAADIDIELQDGTTVIWRDVIGLGNGRGSRVGTICENNPFSFTPGTAVNLVVDAGGANVVTVLSLKGHTQ